MGELGPLPCVLATCTRDPRSRALCCPDTGGGLGELSAALFPEGEPGTLLVFLLQGTENPLR